MTEMVTIPKAEYARLKALEDERLDVASAAEVLARIESGDEELIPSIVIDRILAGVSPLAVWRQYRGLSEANLARLLGVNRAQIIDIEAGRKTGSVHTLNKLARVLSVDIQDLVAEAPLPKAAPASAPLPC